MKISTLLIGDGLAFSQIKKEGDELMKTVIEFKMASAAIFYFLTCNIYIYIYNIYLYIYFFLKSDTDENKFNLAILAAT